MSAYQVSPNHLGALVRWYLSDHGRGIGQAFLPYWRGHQPNHNDADDMLACLAEECYRSVRYRYPTGPLPGLIAFPDGPVVCQGPLSQYPLLSPVEVLKAVHGLEYQSCEHPEWEQSEAYRLLRNIERTAMCALPGYEEAAWSL